MTFDDDLGIHVTTFKTIIIIIVLLNSAAQDYVIILLQSAYRLIMMQYMYV